MAKTTAKKTKKTNARITVLNVLKRIRKLFDDRKNWTRGASARDKWGHWVPPRNKSAVRWCLLGAICLKAHKLPDRGSEIEIRLKNLTGDRTVSLININDSQGYRKVIKLLDKAIAEGPW